MATPANTTKPVTATSTPVAPKSSLAEVAAKLPAKPTPDEANRLIEESRGEVEGMQITVENDLEAPAAASTEGSTTPATTTQAVTTLGFFDEDLPALPEGKYGIRPLTKTDMDELKANEAIVRAGLPQFLAVAEALLNIKKKKLWRLYSRSFADYCDKRLGISREWAHLQASAAEVMHNLSTSGQQMLLPISERQLRPLASLEAKLQVQAWQHALEKAAGKKVTGKQVEEAVKELSGDVLTQSEWLAKCRHLLTKAGYEADFVQPVNVGDREWIDFLHEPSNIYVKLLDAPSLSGVGICLAMREQGVECQVVLNGAALSKKKLTAHADGTLDRLLDPVLSVFMHNLKALLERDEVLYEAGALGKDSTLELILAKGNDTQHLRDALQNRKVAQAAENPQDAEQLVGSVS